MVRLCRRRNVFLWVTAVLAILCITELQQYSDVTQSYQLKPFENWRNQSSMPPESENELTKSPKTIKTIFVNITKTERRLQNLPTFIMPNSEQKRIYVKAQGFNVYMFTAIGVSYKSDDISGKFDYQYSSNRASNISTYNTIVINGWEDKFIQDTSFKCCIYLVNGTMMTSLQSRKRDWGYLGMARLQAKQYVCPLAVHHTLVHSVAVTKANNSCVYADGSFLRPVFAMDAHNRGVAVCTKLAFGSLDAGRLIEWMEAHRYLGVTKVLVYPFNLNEQSRRVLDFYEKLGFVEQIPFALPERDRVRRVAGGKAMQSWNDEQVVVYDCQERLATYKYVAVIDTDEYLVPNGNATRNAWMTYLDTMWTSPRIAGLRFQTKVHITDWGPTNNGSSLFIGQYLNSTAAIFDRPKNIYIPSRVVPGSVATHALSALPGYFISIVMRADSALHHFRGCRWEWRRGNTFLHKMPIRPFLRRYKSADLLDDFIRHPSPDMKNLADKLEISVKTRKAWLNITDGRP